MLYLGTCSKNLCVAMHLIDCCHFYWRFIKGFGLTKLRVIMRYFIAENKFLPTESDKYCIRLADFNLKVDTVGNY